MDLMELLSKSIEVLERQISKVDFLENFGSICRWKQELLFEIIISDTQ